MKKKFIYQCIAVLWALSVVLSCDRPFEYSPYQATTEKKYHNTTDINLQKIKSLTTPSSDFSFAFISDTHYHYSNLRTVIDHINANESIQFVLFGGDIADQGLLKEFELFYSQLENLKKPYLVVMGNHDYLSNGEDIYKKMYGDYNFSFEFNNYKFVMFDDVFWESDKTPDFNWLENELSDAFDFESVFMIAHIAPFGDQFDAVSESRFRDLMSASNVQLSLHGHSHHYLFKEYYADGVNYLVVPSMEDPVYSIITVENGIINSTLIDLD